ncbi:MAG: response regulator, partial [Thermodesulfobacteriota bacterium]|nr:response regulator [Thermodesulfobacteriota bacterium]
MGRLLIVDDEVNVLKTYQRLLLDAGHEIVCAASGEEALKKAPEFKPDIVLLDIMMPGMDGYEVCEQLKANEETNEAEVIFVSAKGETRDRLKGYSVRSSDFLVKPFSPAELRAK